MRFVVVGAGAIGGVVGGRLAQHGHDVALVARGPHRDAMAADGLLIRSPDDEVRVHPRIAGHVDELDLGAGDVVLLAVKGQDTRAAIDGIPPELPIACLQNGVANERELLRRFADVYAVPVMLPALHLVPGVVDASSAPTTGILDVGCYPTGVDATAEAIAAALASSSFSSIARADVMRFKWSKLLLNLGNALDAACGPPAWGSPLWTRAMAEGRAVIEAAGVDAASDEEDTARRGDLVRMRPIAGERRAGGSTWQSLQRGSGAVEVDLLNGEIVLLGRLHGVPTPVNAVLQRTVNDLARRRGEPGSVRIEDVEAEVARAEQFAESSPD
jgi:2-dehydropantoate 2-reductase